MAIIVERVQRYQKVGDKTSPQLYYLKRKAKNSRLYDASRKRLRNWAVCPPKTWST